MKIKIFIYFRVLCFCLWAHTASGANLVQSCDAVHGLQLLNQAHVDRATIKAILDFCDLTTFNDTNVLLLHGLLARKEVPQNRHYETAIFWLTQAKASADPTDLSPALELAVTYEWANEPQKAAVIYQAILADNPYNRAARLGQARVLKMQTYFSEATACYLQLLDENTHDIEALNGLGWVKLAEHQLLASKHYFDQVLNLQSQNKEALIGLQEIKLVQQQAVKLQESKLVEKPVVLCDADEGLILLNQTNPPFNEIKHILSVCDKVSPTASHALLLHGLLARKTAVYSSHYTEAIAWLEKAKAVADPEFLAPALELAVTYEWAGDADKAGLMYQQILTQQPHNRSALLGQARVIKMQAAMKFAKSPPPLCDADQGLILLSQTKPPLAEIKQILRVCDKNTPHATSALLLHGLLARKAALQTNHYETAIAWLLKANAAAASDDVTPALELAITYEWTNEPQKAAWIYQTVRFKYPHNRAATLGQARVFKMQFRINEAIAIYRQLLKENPYDVEALNGLGISQMANFQLRASKQSFESALRVEPGNQASIQALQALNKTTKYIMSITGGNYTVGTQSSVGTDVYFFNNLNATDGLAIFATHNSKQIGTDFFTTPTLLPDNSILLGFQRNVPNQYGWTVSYDYREHNHLPLENRIRGTGSFYLGPTAEWFGGIRAGFPSPWNNQLYFSGVTLFTKFPANISFTGFYGNDQFGGANTAYSLDFSKEFADHTFYNLGAAYSPTLANWEIHGRIIWPTFTNQAFVADYSHYYFNGSTFFNAGWRIYWA